MLRVITSFLCTFVMGFSMLFGAPQSGPMDGSMGGPPPRTDKLDFHSPAAHMKLARAERILGTLVSDPQSYQLILSSRSNFGGEAFPPFVYSDKPTIIVYQGALSPDRSNEELAFMLAHELGHLNMYHNEKMAEQMEKIFTGPPMEISGTIFTIFYQKLQERHADMFGLGMYQKAGYTLNFFPYTLQQLKINPNIHFGSSNPIVKEPPSMSMKNSHFSMTERFDLLVKEAHMG